MTSKLIQKRKAKMYLEQEEESLSLILHVRRFGIRLPPVYGAFERAFVLSTELS